MVERSRRPHRSPGQTGPELTAAITELRCRYPDWGARKLHHILHSRSSNLELSLSTVQRIIARAGLIRKVDRHRAATKRFERDQPNQLWQMDFKGPRGFVKQTGPLSVIDDHSRYVLTLRHLSDARLETVQSCLQGTFEHNGVPDSMLMDHGTPWWNANSPWGWTGLTVWMMRQGIRIRLSGYGHPQTQGKIERMHNSLHAAIRKRKANADEQSWLNEFQQEYNQQRPHQALGMRTPASVWKPSSRPYQPEPAEWEYPARMTCMRLNQKGQLHWNNHRWEVSRALQGQIVGTDWIGSRMLIYFCNTPVLEIDPATNRTAVLPVDVFSAT
jgi:transposase InsO family protein